MADVIHLFGEPPAVEGAPEEKPRKGFCRPHWPRIDEVSRVVTCARCQSTLDPVDVLLEVSQRHLEYKRLFQETSTMRKQLEAMKEEEKRVKARTKSHSRKEAGEAVAAEREKYFDQLCEMLTRTAEITRAAKRIEQLTGLRRKP